MALHVENLRTSLPKDTHQEGQLREVPAAPHRESLRPGGDGEGIPDRPRSGEHQRPVSRRLENQRLDRALDSPDLT